MSAYDTPNWAHRILLAIVIGGLLSLVASLALAKEPPTAQCGRFTASKIVCRASFVEPYTPLWVSTIGQRMAEEEEGIVIFLTLDGEWRTITMYVYAEGKIASEVSFDARMNGDSPEFRVEKGHLK